MIIESNQFRTIVAEASSDGESLTTSTLWQQKVNLQYRPAKRGDYVLFWSCELGGQLKTIEVKVEIDNITQVCLHQINPVTAYNAAEPNYPAGGGIYYIVNLTPIVHNFDLDFRSNFAGFTAAIRRARLILMKTF